MKKIVFAGTPEIAQICLQALLTAGYNIQACLTQPDRPKGRGRVLTASPVKQLAIANNIPVYQPEKLQSSNTSELLQQLAPDLIIVVAYGMLIPKAILAIPKYGCINVHTSLLPKWRGAAPIQHAILAGDQESGVTIMQMDAGLDTGAILNQYKCKIANTMTSEELYQQLAILGANGLLETIKQVWSGEIMPTPQQHADATYAHKISKHDGAIDWSQSAEVIARCVRAFNPWPVAYTELPAPINKTVQLRIWRAQTLPLVTEDAIEVGSKVQAPGTILRATDAGIVVATGQGELLLTEVQLPGKKAMPVHEVLKSQHQLFKPGVGFSITM